MYVRTDTGIPISQLTRNVIAVAQLSELHVDINEKIYREIIRVTVLLLIYAFGIRVLRY